MRELSLQFLRSLVNTPSPVGHETRGQRVWLEYARAFADETFSDAYGNCVAVLNKGGTPRVMLAGHADEIAMAVNYINEDGYIYVRKMGGVDPAITKAQRVTIHTKAGPVRGVVGNVAPHLMKEESDKWLLKQRVNGKVVSKAKGLKQILPNVSYDVRVRFDGIQFAVFIDGDQLITMPPGGPVLSGTIGFQVKGTTASFSQIVVTP